MTDDTTPIRRAFDEALGNGRAFVDPKDGVIRSNDWTHSPLVYDEATGTLEKKIRITTYIKTLDTDTRGLQLHDKVNGLIGLANAIAAGDEDVQKMVQALAGKGYYQVKDDYRLWKRTTAAIEHFELTGGNKRAAWWGDLIHKLTEAYEASARTFTAVQAVEAAWDLVESMYIEPMATTGLTLNPGRLHDRLVEQVQHYIDAMTEVEVLECEQQVYAAELGAFGTPDRLCRYQGLVVYADVKTGSNSSVEEQMAVAVHGEPYDYTHGVQPRPAELRPSREVALLIQMPGPGPDWMGAEPGDPRNVLTWLDIRDAMRKVAEIIPLNLEARNLQKNRLPFVAGELPDFVSPPAKPTRKRAVKKVAAVKPEAPEVDEVVAKIEAAETIPEIWDIFTRLTGGDAEHSAWTPERRAAATAKRLDLEAKLNAAGTKPEAA